MELAIKQNRVMRTVIKEENHEIINFYSHSGIVKYLRRRKPNTFKDLLLLQKRTTLRKFNEEGA